MYDFALKTKENVKAAMQAMTDSSKEVEGQVANKEYTVTVNSLTYDVEKVDVKGLVKCIAGQTNIDMMCGMLIVIDMSVVSSFKSAN